MTQHKEDIYLFFCLLTTDIANELEARGYQGKRICEMLAIGTYDDRF